MYIWLNLKIFWWKLIIRVYFELRRQVRPTSGQICEVLEEFSLLRQVPINNHKKNYHWGSKQCIDRISVKKRSKSRDRVKKFIAIIRKIIFVKNYFQKWLIPFFYKHRIYVYINKLLVYQYTFGKNMYMMLPIYPI